MSDLPLENRDQRMLAAITRITEHLKSMENETNEQVVEQMVAEGQVLAAQFEEETKALMQRLRSLALEHSDDELAKE